MPMLGCYPMASQQVAEDMGIWNRGPWFRKSIIAAWLELVCGESTAALRHNSKVKKAPYSKDEAKIWNC